MRIYLAAAYGRQLEMRGVRTQLRQMGHLVTSRWLDQDTEMTFSPAAILHAPPAAQSMARRDMADIEQAHMVINFTDGQPARGGRHVEFGYALALGKRLSIVGPREHVFHTLGRAIWYPDWDTMRTEMETWAVDMMHQLVEEDAVH